MDIVEIIHQIFMLTYLKMIIDAYHVVKQPSISSEISFELISLMWK